MSDPVDASNRPDMGKAPLCCSDEELAGFIEGAIAPSRQEALVRHLVDCADCRGRWGRAETEIPSEGGRAPPDPGRILEKVAASYAQTEPATLKTSWRARFLARPALVAAASLVVAGIAWGLLFRESTHPHRFHRLPEGIPVANPPQTFVGGHEGLNLLLPDQSRLHLLSGARVSLREPTGGERVVLEIEHGGVDAEIAKGEGAVRLFSRAGEITVLGTAFRARAFALHIPIADDSTPRPVSVLTVEVREGTVLLGGSSGEVVVASGRRGVLIKDHNPLLQEAVPVDWKVGIGQYGGFGAAKGIWNAAFLFGATWEGIDAWEEALDDPSPEAGAYRRRVAELVCLAAEPDFSDRLRDQLMRHPDEAVRLAFVGHVIRLLGEQAADFLEKTAAADPSETVRREASRLRTSLE